MSKADFLNAVCNQPTTKKVFGTATSIACQELMDQLGVSFPSAHTDPEKMFRLALAGHTVLHFDNVMPLFSVCHEAAAMGCKINWGNNAMMPESGEPIFAGIDDISIPPDLLSQPGCTVPLQAIRHLQQELGSDAAVCGKVFGPWTQAYHYFGIENFLIMTISDPSAVKTILEKLLPVTLTFARAQLEAGADCILIADHATRDLCSPKAYQEFLIPIHRQIAQELSCPTLLHICGNTGDRIGHIRETGINCFHWDTKTGPPREVRDLAGETLSLMGGISNYKLQRETPEDIKTQSLQAQQAGINIIGPECAIPLTTPLANLKTVTC